MMFRGLPWQQLPPCLGSDPVDQGQKKIDVAKEVGKLIAARLQTLGVDKIVFDRGRFLIMAA